MCIPFKQLFIRSALTVCSLSVEFLLTVTPTVRPSCTPHSNKDGKKTDSGAIAGGVTVAVLLLLAIATAGVLAVLCVRRRAVSAKVQTEGTTNPVYDTNCKLGMFSA